jgi:hypothetical protein
MLPHHTLRRRLFQRLVVVSIDITWTYTDTGQQQEDDKHFQVQLSDESFETYDLDPP